MVADMAVFFVYVHQIIVKIGFFVVVPPPCVDHKKRQFAIDRMAEQWYFI